MKAFTLLLLVVLCSCSNTTETAHKDGLTGIPKAPNQPEVAAVENENDFDSIFSRFSEDSVFQTSRIKFPITVISIEGEEVIHKEKWSYTNFSKLGIGNMKKEQFSDNLINMIYTVEDTGILVYHYFKKQNGKWLLVSIEDLST